MDSVAKNPSIWSFISFVIEGATLAPSSSEIQCVAITEPSRLASSSDTGADGAEWLKSTDTWDRGIICPTN